jgi:predicted HicB family RNase H-like nuclease
MSLDCGLFPVRSLMKRVNIQLEDETHTKAKVIAVLKDMTLNEYFEKAIREAIEKDQAILNKIKTNK